MKNGGSNIYLIGMMGSGKSATGKSLAVLRHDSFVDLDDAIQEKEKRTISEVFAQSGESYFRDVESSILKFYSVKKQHVFATGGGIILRPENVQCMKETGIVILLETSVKVLWQRLRYSKDRPLLNKPDPFGTLTQILNDREFLYKKACHIAVVTDGKSADEVAQEIQKKVQIFDLQN